MLLLAFGNKARQGKDTAGEAVRDYYQQKRDLALRHGLRVIPSVGLYKFAAALYEEARQLHGMVEKDAPLLQRIGSERRAEDPEYWVKKCFKTITDEKPHIAIITDVRYLNEAAAIKAVGGYVIRVSRWTKEGFQYIAEDRPADHPSEVELDDYNFDYEIVAKTGQAAWVAQQAITLANYLQALEKNG
jgi:hypothetical protein